MNFWPMPIGCWKDMRPDNFNRYQALSVILGRIAFKSAAAFLFACLLATTANAQSADRNVSVDRMNILVIHAGQAGNDRTANIVLDMLRHFPVHTEALQIEEVDKTKLSRIDRAILIEEGGTSTAGASISDHLRKTGIPHMWIACGQINDHIRPVQLHYRGKTFPVGHMKAYRLNENVKFGADNVLAYASDGANSTPLIVRDKEVWYITAGIENMRMTAIVADLLHDFLEHPHRDARQGLMIIENVYPLVPPEQLTAIADLLSDHHIPFAIAVNPVYHDKVNGIVYSASDHPGWVEAILYMASRGGTVIVGGNDLPLHVETFSDRLEQNLAVLSHLSLYPIAIALTEETLAAIHAESNAVHFSTVYGSGALKSQIPYVTFLETGIRVFPHTASAGTVMKPHDLGLYISEWDRLDTVRDAWFGFTYDAESPVELLEEWIFYTEDKPVRWIDIRHEPHKVESEWIRIVAPGDGTLEVSVIDKERLFALSQVEGNKARLEGFAFYSSWLLVGIVFSFIVLFVLFTLILHLRRRNRLFTEKELP